jgi:amidophosphoribosyltransferase
MGEEIGHECGIGATYFKNKPKNLCEVSRQAYAQGYFQNHRGQLSAGVASLNPFKRGYEQRLKCFVDVGTVDLVFQPDNHEKFSELMRFLKGVAQINHVRYATAGRAKNRTDLLLEAQPRLRHHPRLWKRFATAMNGNLANYKDLRGALIKEGYSLDTFLDTEVVECLFALNLKRLSGKTNKKPSLFEVAHAVMGELDGGYSMALLFGDGDLMVLRDPYGIRPLMFGEHRDFYGVASESIALEKIGISEFHSVPPGSAMIINKKGVQQQKIITASRTAFCAFEDDYFAKSFSWINEGLVDERRMNLGMLLARTDPRRDYFTANRDNTVVVPMPNTAIPATEAYSKVMGLHWSMAIEKTKGLRGFINRPSERERIMKTEYSIHSNRIKDKIVIVVEDSIVRGETGKLQVADLRKAGAKEVHFRSTFPPVTFPCYYGVDFPTHGELIAYGPKDIEDIQRKVSTFIGADSVFYQTKEGYLQATGFRENELCTACFTGNYPTRAGQINAESSLARESKDKCPIKE